MHDAEIERDKEYKDRQKKGIKNEKNRSQGDKMN